MTLYWFLAPASGALIGWLTNWLAIRMLFRPRNAWRLPGTGLSIQGLLPRRRAELAKLIGQVVQDELLSPQWIAEQLLSDETKDWLIDEVVAAIRERLMNSWPAWISKSLGPLVVGYAERVVRQELNLYFENRMDKLITGLGEELHIASAIEEQINELSLEEVERLTVRLATRELRFIELLGAVLGGVIGFLQAVLWSISS